MPSWYVTTITRDDLCRPTQVTYPNSPQGVPGYTVTTEYDEFGRVDTAGEF